jgi:uncharacterized protein (TIGR03503 family)
LATFNSFAHTIYEANDIPLLDNRFRIDPNTEQVTIILNHPQQPQKIVIVQPDGSKLYEQRHPKESVAWLATRDQDIITISNPMVGPWQAIARLDGENRIQLLNPISLEVGKIPVRVYRDEYITTDVSLMRDGAVMADQDFLKNAKLTVTLTGKAKKLISLYKDDGQDYDELPFDGKLTTHMYINLIPGRYSLSIDTRNNIFVRSYNTEMVIFPNPITFNTEQLEYNASSVKFTFIIDAAEIDPNSVSIEGTISSYNKDNSKQSIIHLEEHKAINNIYTVKVPLEYDLYSYSGKAYATTMDGREITLQLPERTFELIAPYVPPEPDKAAELEKAKALEAAQVKRAQQYRYLLAFLAALIALIIIGVLLAVYLMRKKQNKLTTDSGLALDELTIDELQPTSIDIEDENGEKEKESL